MRIDIFPVDTGSVADVVSSLLVSSASAGYAFLNIRDCLLTSSFASTINYALAQLGLDIRLFALGYTGAGPYLPVLLFSSF